MPTNLTAQGSVLSREEHGVSRQMSLNLSLETSVFLSVKWGQEQHPCHRVGGRSERTGACEGLSWVVPQPQTPVGKSSNPMGVRAANDPKEKRISSLTSYPPRS